MVRLLCQNCPRSCCDGGEKVDQIRAEMAVSALYKSETKMTFGTFISVSESSNDSLTTMEVASEEFDTDSDSDNLCIVTNEDGSDSNNNNDQNNNGQNNPGQFQVVEKRKQRRRERNRRSAQAYRQRRRQQTQKVDETLHDLMEKNHSLRQNINKLEEEKTFILDILKTKIKIPWPYPVFKPYPNGFWPNQGVTMSTPMGMDSGVHEVTVAS